MRDFKGNDPKFVAYFLRTLDFRAYSDKAAVPGLNRNHLHLAPVCCPPIHEQRAIARALGGLDDKIELNRRMNETLEAMARALFKSWFVDFDPVRAKMRGEAPAGMDAATAALFPSRLVQTEHGEVPEGWVFDSIGNLVEVVGGSTPNTEEPAYWDGPHAWTRPKDFSGLSAPLLLATERTITDAGLDCIGSGLLLPGSVLLSSRAPIGYLAISRIKVAINQGFIGMKCTGALPSHYVLFCTRSRLNEIKARASGTTFPEISKAAFRPIPALKPEAAVLTRFEHTAAQLFARIENNLRESSSLTRLRDSLLPKLLSGELRVPEAERTVAEVA